MCEVLGENFVKFFTRIWGWWLPRHSVSGSARFHAGDPDTVRVAYGARMRLPRVAGLVVAVAVVAGCTSGGSTDAAKPATPSRTGLPAPSASTSEPVPSPSSSSGAVRRTAYGAAKASDLPRPSIRDVDWVHTTREAGEGQQVTFSSQAARYGVGRRPGAVFPTTAVFDFGSVWTPATDGVGRVSPTTLQLTGYIATGPVIALASSGYTSMYAVVETTGRGLGVVRWTPEPPGAGTLESVVLDDTSDAADGVCIRRCAVAFSELLWITRSYRDRPSELVEVSVVNGTSRVVATFGAPDTELVVDSPRNESLRDLWVGGSDGVLRHFHGDGRVTTLDLGGPIVDVDASAQIDDGSIWLAVHRPNGEPRPVRVDARTDKVTKDVTTVAADQVSVVRSGTSASVWATSVRAAGGSVVTRLDVRTGAVWTTAKAETDVRGVVAGPDGLVFATAPATQELLRVSTGFND